MQGLDGLDAKRITITGGISTRYIDTGGDKPVVILLHGIAASIEAWRDVIAPLRQAFRVIAFDLPGFGHADKPKTADYKAVTFFVPALKSVMDTLGIAKAHLVGSSMGASLIVRFAARYPEMVDRAVLANPGGFGCYIHPFLRVPTIPIMGGLMSMPMRPTNAIALMLTVHNAARRPKALLDEVDAFSKMPGAHHAFVQTLRGIATVGGLKDIPEFEADARVMAAPTLIVWGDKDRIFPVSQTHHAQELMPSAALTIMKDVGHFPQIDAPDAFAVAVLTHLQI